MDAQNRLPEPSPEQPPGNPASAEPPQPPDGGRKRGSLWSGFGLFWVIAALLICLWMGLVLNLGSTYYTHLNVIGFVMFLFPLALSIVLGSLGRTRTAQGIVLGYGSVIALIVLLYAICSGGRF